MIGCGDWAADRIVPDAMRALGRGEPIGIRNPAATRPGQHVLEPLSGCLCLAERLCAGANQADAFSFGPSWKPTTACSSWWRRRCATGRALDRPDRCKGPP